MFIFRDPKLLYTLSSSMKFSAVFLFLHPIYLPDTILLSLGSSAFSGMSHTLPARSAPSIRPWQQYRLIRRVVQLNLAAASETVRYPFIFFSYSSFVFLSALLSLCKTKRQPIRCDRLPCSYSKLFIIFSFAFINGIKVCLEDHVNNIIVAPLNILCKFPYVFVCVSRHPELVDTGEFVITAP